MAVTITATGPTALRSYVFPDYDAKLLTSTAEVRPYTIGDLLYASSTTALSKLAGVATGQVLMSGGVGVAPAWSGTIDVTGFVRAVGNLISNTGFYPTTSARSGITAPADGQLNVTNNAATAGVGMDVATDAVLKVRTRAQSAYGTVDCLGLKASGAAGASFGPAAVASITVVNGIVTACS
jgi:hypothetical protein